MKVHFIGIGGIGVSSLAQYYLQKGHRVSGSDLVASEITDFLKKRGVQIFLGNKAKNISQDFDLVVHSPAVKPANPEYAEAKKLGIKTISYPEALGELTKNYFTIAISGAHGKSTTTSIIGLILAKGGLDPTVIVGTKLKEFGQSNFRMGGCPQIRNLKLKIINSEILVIEACEYDGSFLNYEPSIIVATNLDKEHLDYFKNFKNVVKTFKDFILKLPKGGFLVANKDDKNLLKISKPAHAGRGKFNTKLYSLKQKEAKKIKSILKIPGQHNVYNALAALQVARILNIPDKVSLKALSEYRGSWRRFEIIKTKPYTLISDYGHHPNEVLVTLKATREKYPNKRIWCIFQPHQYQRTHYLFNDFVKTFRQVPIDNIIITDIYDVAGREEKKISSSVSSSHLVKKINKNYIKYLSVDNAEKYVKENIKNGDILIIMGAGDIYKLADRF